MAETMTTPVGVRKVVTTDELMTMLARGEQVYLPEVQAPEASVLVQYSAQDRARLAVSAADNPIVSVEYLRDEEVQCISVADERHLYITDDFIPTHNTSNIVFLKSTDDSMMDTLQKMSGVTHKSYTDSKTVTKDMERIMMQTEGKVSYTMTTKEEPVISYNDMAFIAERNSIVFRAGDSPVWNRNETILPMSHRLFKHKIEHPGHDYTLMTIPTLSTALDFDVRLNQPDFTKMLDKRMKQGQHSVRAKKMYQEAYGHSDFDISRLDPDVYSDEVMGLIESIMWENSGINPNEVTEVDVEAMDSSFMFNDDEFEADHEAMKEASLRQEVRNKMGQKIYAGAQISRDMLINPDGTGLSHTLDNEIVGAYKHAKPFLGADTQNFVVGGDGSLRSRDGRTTYITKMDETEALRAAQKAVTEEEMGVYAEENVADSFAGITAFEVHPEFYKFLGSLDTWAGLGNGEFDRAMTQEMRRSLEVVSS